MGRTEFPFQHRNSAYVVTGKAAKLKPNCMISPSFTTRAQEDDVLPEGCGGMLPSNSDTLSTCEGEQLLDTAKQGGRDSRRIRNAFARLAANSGAGFLSRIGVYVPTFLVLGYISGSLGAQGYGTWALVTTIVGYTNLLDMGLAFGLTRYFAHAFEKKDYRHVERVLASGLIIYAIMGLGVISIGWLCRHAILSHFRIPPPFEADASVAFVLVLCGFSVTNFNSVLQAVLLGIQRADLVSGLNVLTSLASAAGMAIAVHFVGSVSAVVAGQLTAYMLAALLTFGVLRSKVPQIRLVFNDLNWRETRSAMSFGVKVMMSRLASSINFSVDTLLLGAMVGAVAVSRMDLGIRAGSVIISLSWMLSMPVMPMISALQVSASDRERRELIERIDRTYYPVLFFLAGGMFVCADALVLAWLGPVYRQVGTVIRVLAIAYLGITMTYPRLQCLRGIGRMKLEICVSAGRLIGHVMLSWFLIRLWGLRGALVAVSIVLIGSGIFFNLSAHRMLHGDMAPLVRRLGLLTGVTALAVGAGHIVEVGMVSLLGASRPSMAASVLICAATFAAVYGFALYLTKQLQISDLREFVAFRRSGAAEACDEWS